MAATDLYLIRKNQQCVKYSAVEALSVTGPATTDEIEVWSSEFRDIFSSSAQIPVVGNVQGGGVAAGSYSGPGTFSLSATNTTAVAPTSIAASDEVSHEGLRQTALKRTFWKFDLGAASTPRYLYAWVLEGDIIANNPPDTA